MKFSELTVPYRIKFKFDNLENIGKTTYNITVMSSADRIDIAKVKYSQCDSIQRQRYLNRKYISTWILQNLELVASDILVMSTIICPWYEWIRTPCIGASNL